jgi:hypothetical protein
MSLLIHHPIHKVVYWQARKAAAPLSLTGAKLLALVACV